MTSDAAAGRLAGPDGYREWQGPGRPDPLRLAASSAARWRAAIAAIVVAAAGVGIIADDRSPVVQGLLTAAAAGAAALIVVWTAVHTARLARPFVTPLADPRDDYGRHLVPEPAGPGRHSADRTDRTDRIDRTDRGGRGGPVEESPAPPEPLRRSGVGTGDGGDH